MLPSGKDWYNYHKKNTTWQVVHISTNPLLIMETGGLPINIAGWFKSMED